MRNVELAEKVGVSRSYITKFFNGEISPSPEILKNFAKVLEIPEDDLFRDAGYLSESKQARRSTQEQRLIELYEQLSDEGRELLEKQIRDVLIPFFKKKGSGRRKAEKVT